MRSFIWAFTDSGFDTGERQRQSQIHTKNRESESGGALCRKLNSGRDDMEQSNVGVDDLERFSHSYTATIE